VGNGWAVGWVAFVANVAYRQLPTALCGDVSCADLLFDTQADSAGDGAQAGGELNC
jgi:hypothetical protein